MRETNLLFIYTDQQAFNTLAAYGNSLIHMPNLDRLAERSYVFEEAYVTQPVCTPSRSSLLTGLYPHASGLTENNLILPNDIPCLPEMFPAGKYVTGHFGKWHLGDELFAQHGFRHWRSIEDSYNAYFSEGRDRSRRSDYHAFLIENGFSPGNGVAFKRDEAAGMPEEFGKPYFLAREASRFLRENKNRPFILYVNFLEPHMPYFGPRDGQYAPSDMPLPPNYADIPGGDQPLKARLIRDLRRRVGFKSQPLANEDDWRRLIANYWGLCSLIDTHVGTVLDTLEDCGLRDDTLIVFTSDHGDMMGAHQLLAKSVMYQEALRVPYMVSLPGQRTRHHIKGPISQVDTVPTLLELMSRSYSGRLQGESLCSLMKNGKSSSGRPVFAQWNGPNSGMGRYSEDKFATGAFSGLSREEFESACSDPVRTVITPDGWKLNCSPLGEHELYNLRSDPLETENVFETERVRRRELRELLGVWQKETGDSVELPVV